MATLIISDIHIGDPRLNTFNKVEKIIQLLKKPWDQIILNGDIVDLWIDDSLSNTLRHPIIQKLEQVSENNIPIRWIVGNHDYRIDDLLKDKVSFNFSKSLTIGNMLFIHGHQLDLRENKWWYAKLGTIWNIWVWEKFKFDVQMWWHTTKNYQGECHADRKEILKHGYKERIIVMGHTHRAAHQFKMNGNDVGQEVYDIGSAMEMGTYGILDNGKISLHRM